MPRSPTPHPLGPQLVIAHRGASALRPEHTLAAYALAIELGADFIEPDLVSTRDHVLVVRHENEISGTTDVADHPEFAARRTTKSIDGVEHTGFFTEDFSLAELKTLRARERLPELRPQNRAFDGQLEIATFEEVIALAAAASRRVGRPIGLYPETKHPSYFADLGLPLEPPLLRALDRHGYSGPHAAVCIQSFEVDNLRRLRRQTELPLVQLMDASGAPWDFVRRGEQRSYAELATPAGLSEVAEYARAIGVHKQLIVPRDARGASLAPSALVRDAHAEGLWVHAWTFRSENHFLPSELRIGHPARVDHAASHGQGAAEYDLFFRLGVDGVFSDDPGVAVKARGALAASLRENAP